VNPHDGTFFLGGQGGWRSTDGAVTWSLIKTHPDARAIAFDPADGARVWLGNDGGLSRSTNGGAAVASLAQTLPVMQFYAIRAHPTDPNIVYGGTQDNGLQRGRAFGTWTEVLGGDVGAEVFDTATSRLLMVSLTGIVLRRRDDGTGPVEQVGSSTIFGPGARFAFLAPLVRGADGTVWIGSNRIFASHDFGTTWTAPAGTLDLTDGKPATGSGDVLTTIAVSASDPRVVYTGSAAGRMMVTHDAGVTWTDITPPEKHYAGGIAVDPASPSNAYVAFTAYRGKHVLRTTDFGATWSDFSAGLPDVPMQTIYIDPRDPSRMYVGTDIGVFRSVAGGDWEPFDSGMPPVKVTSFTTTADGRLLAGTYGRGIYRLADDPPSVTGPHRRSVRH